MPKYPKYKFDFVRFMKDKYLTLKGIADIRNTTVSNEWSIVGSGNANIKWLEDIKEIHPDVYDYVIKDGEQ